MNLLLQTRRANWIQVERCLKEGSRQGSYPQAFKYVHQVMIMSISHTNMYKINKYIQGKQVFPVINQICPVFKQQICPVFKQICPLSKEICPVFKQICPLSKEICKLFKQICSIVQQTLPLVNKCYHHLNMYYYSLFEQICRLGEQIKVNLW